MILNYNNFIKEEYFITPQNELFSIVVENLYFNLLTNEERKLIEQSNIHLSQINENFFDKLKSRYDNAKKVAQDIGKDAKIALQKLVVAAKDVVEFVSKMKTQLVEYSKRILTNAKNDIKEKLKANSTFTQEVRNKLNKEKSALIKDLHTCGEVSKFYKEEFTNKLSEIFSKSLSGFLSKNDTGYTSTQVEERLSYIVEGNNMIDKLVNGVSHLPPFSWLHQIKHVGEKGVNGIISFLSSITNKLGGPDFSLPVMASILGIAFEYNVKGLAKHGILDVVSFFTIPFISLIIKLLAYVATFLAGYELIKEIISGIENNITH